MLLQLEHAYQTVLQSKLQKLDKRAWLPHQVSQLRTMSARLSTAGMDLSEDLLSDDSASRGHRRRHRSIGGEPGTRTRWSRKKSNRVWPEGSADQDGSTTVPHDGTPERLMLLMRRSSGMSEPSRQDSSSGERTRSTQPPCAWGSGAEAAQRPCEALDLSPNTPHCRATSVAFLDASSSRTSGRGASAMPELDSRQDLAALDLAVPTLNTLLDAALADSQLAAFLAMSHESALAARAAAEGLAINFTYDFGTPQPQVCIQLVHTSAPAAHQLLSRACQRGLWSIQKSLLAMSYDAHADAERCHWLYTLLCCAHQSPTPFRRHTSSMWLSLNGHWVCSG